MLVRLSVLYCRGVHHENYPVSTLGGSFAMNMVDVALSLVYPNSMGDLELLEKEVTQKEEIGAKKTTAGQRGRG